MKNLKSKNKEIVKASLFSLWKMQDNIKLSLEDVTQLLDHEDKEIQKIAIQTLGYLHKYIGKEHVKLVDKILEDENFTEVGGLALEKVFASTWRRDGLNKLKKILEGKNDKQKKHVLRIMGYMQEVSNEFLISLKGTLKSSNPEIREETLETIKKLDEFAEPLIPELSDMLKDRKNNSFAETIKNIIKNLKEKKNAKLPRFGNYSICEVLTNKIDTNKWRSLKNYNPELNMTTSSWDTALLSLNNLFSRNQSLLKQNKEKCYSLKNETMDGKFSQSIQSLLQRSEAHPDQRWSAIDTYAKVFYLTHLRKIKSTDLSLINRLSKSIAGDVRQLKEKVNGNSAMNTYSHGTSLAAIAKHLPNDIYSKAQDWINQKVDPMKLPYSFSQPSPVSRENSSARNPPIHLALYMKAKTRRNKTLQRSRVFESLKTWMKYHVNLADEVPKDRKGDFHQGKHGTASYYFYSSLPYVTSSLKILLRDEKITEEQRTYLIEMKKELKASLPGLVSENGLQYLQEKNHFKSNSGYNTPLYGLALTSLLDESDPCYSEELKDDFGIVIP